MASRSVVLIVITIATSVTRVTAAPDRARESTTTGQYIVSLNATATLQARAGAQPTVRGPRALGVILGRNLLDGIDAGRANLATTRRDVDRDVANDFDPARIWLLEAADSVTAAAVAGELVRQGTASWTEPVVMREACDEPAWRNASQLHLGAPPADFPSLFPNDPMFRDGRQWGLSNTGARGGTAGADIHAPAAWQRSCGASWLRLAVLDTGIDPAHPDLQHALPGGERIERGLNVTAEWSRSWVDSAAHGTAVAGVMAALTHDGTHFDSLGMAGVCGGDGAGNPGCRIMPIKIAAGHSTTASSFDLARGIIAAVTQGARVANVSFGGAAPSRLEREALRYAMERNCLVVAASGNRGASAPREAVYPAAYAADGLCLQVGATDAWDRRAAFSSYGPGLDVVAPGLDIWTTFLTYPSAGGAMYPGYVAVSGTSFAAPFTAGVAGLLVAARPELFADDLRELIRRSARDIGTLGAEEATGTGMLDAAASLVAIGPGIGVWHDEVAATEWHESGIDSLVVTENGPGNMTGPRTWASARRIEARATITLPDSFLGGVSVWPRIAGTSTVRGDFRLPYFVPHAQVEWTGERSFVLKGWLYRVIDGMDSLDVPLPFDQARFGFTLLGPLHAPRLAHDDAPRATRLDVRPNPFSGALHIEPPRNATIDVIDITGRRVRRWLPDGSVGAIVWDGRDAAGSRAPPGLYWVRARASRGSSQLRVIKLE